MPTYVVRRAPDGGWGFVLESCWGAYAAVGPAPAPEHGAGLACERQDGRRWGSEGESGEEDRFRRPRNVRQRLGPFAVESSEMEDGSS